jgi:SAM-dependent methyltransferase
VPEPYHRFVYDERRRVLVGDFEEMYRREDTEHYDSWHQETLSQNWRTLALALIHSRRPRSLLDIGCGKGAFTSKFKAERILGIDVSQTALAKARKRNPLAEFRCLRAEELASIDEHFELAVCLEMLSFVENWRGFVADLASVADTLFLSLYLPPTSPIGFVKSFDDLREGIGVAWDIDCDVLVVDRNVNGSQLLVLADRRD